MITLTQLIGGGGSSPSAGVGFDGMPIFGGESGTVIPPSSCYIKTGASAVSARSTPQFFNSFSAGFGANAQVNSPGVWVTLVSTAGTKGKLTNIIPPVTAGDATSPETLEVEVTIDGKVHVYTMHHTSGAIRTHIIGGIYTSYHVPLSYDAGASSMDTMALPMSWQDPGFNPYYYAYILPTAAAIANGLPYLSWLNDMQIRVRLSAFPAAWNAADHYMAAAYNIE